MVKLISSFIGLFVLIISGIALGYLAAVFFERKNFEKYKLYEPSKLFEESFSILAAAVVTSGEINNKIILETKNIFIDLFGVEKAVYLMNKFKKFIKKKHNKKLLNFIFDAILCTFDYKSRIYLLNNLFAILKIRNKFSFDEIYFIEKLALSTGIEGNDFESILKNNRMRGNYQEKEFVFIKVNKSDPYVVFNLTSEATADQIKKQYRILCKKYHPDLTHSLSEKEQETAKVKLKEIINAYEKIKKEKKL